MATITVADQPELTKECAIEVFRRHFAGKYEMEERKGPVHDFVVKKSDWTAVWVRLRQGQNGTTFSFAGFTPSLRYRLLPVLGVIGGLPGIVVAYVIMYLALRPSRKAMEEEISQFIRNGVASESVGQMDSVPQDLR